MSCPEVRLHGTGVNRAAGHMGRWVEQQVCHPVAALALAGLVWAWLHPASFHVAQCLAAAIPVQAGYAATMRQTARGQLVQGIGTATSSVRAWVTAFTCTGCS